MQPEFLLWGIPGYIAFLVFQLARPVRNRSGWDFVAQTSLFALAIYVVSRCLIAVASTHYPLLVSTTASFVKQVIPSDISAPLGLGLLCSVPTGIIIGVLWRVTNRLFSLIFGWLFGIRRDYRFTDTFFATCSQLVSELVMLSMDNEKVYVGILIEASDDPNESSRFLKLAPIMSGYRKEPEKRVVFNTDYVGAGNEPDQRRDMLISVQKVVTIAQFDPALHQHFFETGMVGIEPEAVV